MQKRHTLTLEQYKLIEHLLPGRKGTVGPNADNHKFLNAIFWILKTGVPWRDLLPFFGNWNTVHRRFSRWCKAGIFQNIFEVLVNAYKDDFSSIQLDSSVVKTHQHASGSKKKAA
jgi:transposase